MWTTPRGRRYSLAGLVVLALMLLAPATPALAAPGDPDDEGGTAALREQLEAANKGFIDAQAKLDESKKRQAELTQQLADTETRLKTLTEQATVIAATAYRTGGLRTASVLLGSGSADSFVDRVTTINMIALTNDRQLNELSRLRREYTTNKAAVDAEVVTQQQQLEIMANKKRDVEKALAANGGGAATSGPSTTNAATAKAGPGSGGGCTVNDPTTDGCITARTLHALQQAKAAGFTRFVSCFRSGGGGEHPKGRACDFAAQSGGFGGVATGGDKTYGDNLTAYFVKNAKPLAVLYVIWFKRIWSPASGWRTYSGGNGDPASDHTNHVHLSVNV
jgi:septal ring factor EnvC (AmiA/AmiB activator)